MIQLTRLNNSMFYLNPDLLQCIEETPDTGLTLSNGDHYIVRESAAEVIDRIVAYRVRILRLVQERDVRVARDNSVQVVDAEKTIKGQPHKAL